MTQRTDGTKRITVSVDQNIDAIRAQLHKDSGVDFSYVQTLNFLISFYMKHANQPKTQWRPFK